jgi:hypothetical protein
MSEEFPEKYKKLLNKLAGEFADSANGKTSEELRKEILKAEAFISEVEKTRASDHKLNGAKDLVKELSKPYREDINVASAKIKYAVFLIEGRGETVDKK